MEHSTLNIGFLNFRGQLRLTIARQKQAEDFILKYKLDILHCQEIQIEDDTFSQCNFIQSNYYIIKNNSSNNYGTASIIKNNLTISNINLDIAGRVIIFDVDEMTFGNVYLPSGTDNNSRINRENYLAEIIPKLLINCKPNGVLGGDFNCISNNIDCTNNPESKVSPSLKRLISSFSWSDSFRYKYPNSRIFSHYHNTGATRIDTSFHWGNLKPIETSYMSVPLSYHMGFVTTFEFPENIKKILSPKFRPLFKIIPEIIFTQLSKLP